MSKERKRTIVEAIIIAILILTLTSIDNMLCKKAIKNCKKKGFAENVCIANL